MITDQPWSGPSCSITGPGESPLGNSSDALAKGAGAAALAPTRCVPSRRNRRGAIAYARRNARENASSEP